MTSAQAFCESVSKHKATVRDLVHVHPDGVSPQASPNDDEKVLCSGGVHWVFPSDSWEIEESCQLCANESWLKTTPLGKRAAKLKKAEVCRRGHSLTVGGSRLPDGRCQKCSADYSKRRRKTVKANGPIRHRFGFNEAFAVKDDRLIPKGPNGPRFFEGEVDDVVDGSIIVLVTDDVEGGRRAVWTAVLAARDEDGHVHVGDRIEGEAHFTRSPADISSSFGQIIRLEVTGDHAEEDARFGLELSGAFWSKVRREEGRAGCWIWTGAVDRRTGRGRGDVYGSRRPAHLHVWEVFNEPLERGTVLEETCGNPFCVRPSHQRATQAGVLAGAAAENKLREACTKCGGELTPSRSGRECVPCRRERDRINTAASRARRALREMEATA